MPDIQVREADFDSDYTAIRRIRFAVFVDEQRVPASLEMDERDSACIHVLAFVAGAPVGTGRLDVDGPDKRGKIGRVAVLASARRQGVGRAVMEHLHGIARRRAVSNVWCHAQVAAVPFYERLGYRVVGGVFEEAGIDHVCMERALGAASGA